MYRMVNAVLGADARRRVRPVRRRPRAALQRLLPRLRAWSSCRSASLLDRFGPRRVNAALLLVAAAGGAWFALAGSRSRGDRGARPDRPGRLGLPDGLAHRLRALVSARAHLDHERHRVLRRRARRDGGDGAARAAAARLGLARGVPAHRRRDRGGEPGAVAVGAGAARRRGAASRSPSSCAASARCCATRRSCASRCASARASAPRWRCRRCGSPPGCATSPARARPRWRAACSRSTSR